MNKASFIRKPILFESHYTQLPNLWARDCRLGWRARGILLFLMSHQNGWRTSLEHLANEGPDGLAAIRTAINELEAVGYLRRETTQTSSDWIITDPFEEKNELSGLEDNFDFIEDNCENRSYDTFENRTLKNTNLKNTNKEYINDDFNLFWDAYPRKVGRGAAQKAFAKATKIASVNQILSGVINYAKSGSLPEMQFIPHASTWLNQERWDDVVEHSAATKTSTSIAQDIIQRSRQMSSQSRQEIEG
jgi:hypothetical protein